MPGQIGVWQEYNGYIYRRRQEGMTLQQIAEEVGGVSRERVRQILIKHYGSTRIGGFLSTKALAVLADISIETISNYVKTGILQPLPYRQNWLFSPEESLSRILAWRKRHRCKICSKTVELPRNSYCSQACARTGQKEAHKRCLWRSFLIKRGKPVPPSVAKKTKQRRRQQDGNQLQKTDEP